MKQTRTMIVLVKKDMEAANQELCQVLEDMDEDDVVKQSEVYQQAKEYISTLSTES